MDEKPNEIHENFNLTKIKQSYHTIAQVSSSFSHFDTRTFKYATPTFILVLLLQVQLLLGLTVN